ncbi:MAG: hypothetical protein QG608_2844 [Actinomycetota bacterium]|nr:hypothetical protein [Actinomycetota bacterium]
MLRNTDYRVSPELLARDDFRTACTNRDFGVAFRLMRKYDGASQDRISSPVQGLTQSRVSRIVRGSDRVATLDLIERIVDGLGIPGSYVGLADREWERSPSAISARPRETTPDRQARPAARLSISSPPPAESSPFLGTAAHPTTTSASDSSAFPERPRASAHLVTWLERTLHQHYTDDNLVGPRVLLPVITAQIATIEQARSETRGQLEEDLLRTGAAFAEFAGWLCQDAGNPGSARAWYARALEEAEAAGDERMSAFVLMRRATQAISAGDGQYAVRLARAAQRDHSDHTARIRALAAQTEALGHALLGDTGDVERALHHAAVLTEQRDQSPSAGDPSHQRYCDLRLYLKISTAKCRLSLGDGDAAVTAFTEVINHLPHEYHRDRGQYLARLARASVLAGLPEQASEHAQQALSIALNTGSSRTFSDVRHVAHNLSTRWPTLPQTHDLREILDSVRTTH